jgi:hypothetical protein
VKYTGLSTDVHIGSYVFEPYFGAHSVPYKFLMSVGNEAQMGIPFFFFLGMIFVVQSNDFTDKCL